MFHRRWKKIILIALVILAGVLGFSLYRKARIEQLYRQATGYSSMRLPFIESTDSEDAVARLASYRGVFVTHLLLDIALNKEQFSNRVRLRVIEHLQERGGTEEAAALATLLQPHQTIDLRQATAQALRRMSCKEDCIASILHYFERILAGEKNEEDMREAYLMSLTGVPVETTKYLTQQNEIYDMLDQVLKRERSSTFSVLVNQYGLESGFPAPIAVEIVSRIQLSEACPWLVRAKSLGSPHAARDEKLLRALESLGCR